MRRGPLVLGVAVLAVGVAALLVPPLVRTHRAPLAGTPVPEAVPGQEARVRLAPRQRACVDGVVLDPRAERVGFRIAGPRGVQPVRVTLAGPGYASRLLVSRGYGPRPTPLLLPIARPPRELTASACFRNLGRAPVELWGTRPEDAEARPVSVVDGRPTRVDLELTLHEGRDSSVGARLGEVMDRMALFKPSWAPEWLLWALAVLVLIAVPLGALWPLWRALGEDG